MFVTISGRILTEIQKEKVQLKFVYKIKTQISHNIQDCRVFLKIMPFARYLRKSQYSPDHQTQYGAKNVQLVSQKTGPKYVSYNIQFLILSNTSNFEVMMDCVCQILKALLQSATINMYYCVLEYSNIVSHTVHSNLL